MTTKRKPQKRTKDTVVSRQAGKESAPKPPSGSGSPKGAVERRASSRKNPVRQEEPARPTTVKRRWPRVVVLAAVLLVAVAAAAFSWDRWLRFDDSHDLTGEWSVAGTAGVIVIDAQDIKLTDDVSYPYTLDTGAKTIAFSFGNMSGEGRYRFSPDRTQLTVVEQGEYSWVSTLLEDIGWSFDNLVRSFQGQPAVTTLSGDSVTTLSRLSHDGSATPQSDASPAASEEPSASPSDEGSADAVPTDSEGADAQEGEGDDAAASGATGSPTSLFDVSDA